MPGSSCGILIVGAWSWLLLVYVLLLGVAKTGARKCGILILGAWSWLVHLGMFVWLWVLLRGVAKTIVPSDWC